MPTLGDLTSPVLHKRSFIIPYLFMHFIFLPPPSSSNAASPLSPHCGVPTTMPGG